MDRPRPPAAGATRRPTIAALLSALGVLAWPGVAHATDMSGLAVIVFGMFLGVPAFVLLGLALGVTLIARRRPQAPWGQAWARWALVGAPLLAFVFPASMLFQGGAHAGEMLGLALVFDLPNLVVAGAIVALAGRLLRPPT